MKICPNCNQDKALDDFYRCSDKPSGRQSWCKICLKAAAKKDYRVNDRKSIFIERAKVRAQEIRDFVNDLKIRNPCVFCSEPEPCCLDFHHLDPIVKDMDVSYLVRSKSMKRLLIEIQKCVVVCSNCHRKIHAGLLAATEEHLCKIPAGLL